MNKNIMHDGMKLFAFPEDLKQGDVIKIQVLKYANRTHPLYGKLLMDQKYFTNMIRNFNNGVKRDEIPINMEHDRTKAQARFKSLYQEGDGLFAEVELTKDGAENLNGKHYKYFSAEICDKYQDPDTGKRFENVLVGGALTNYPYFNGMEKVVASTPSEDTLPNKPLLSSNTTPMIKDLLKKFSDKKALSFAEKAELLKAFNEATPEEQAEVATEVEATVEKTEEDPKTVEMEKELSALRSEKKFNDTSRKFSNLHIFNQVEEEEAKADAEKVLRAFSTLSDDEQAVIEKVFSNYQAVVETLTNGQLSKSFAKKEEAKEETTSKGKKKITESAFTKICEKYAKEKDMSVNKAYETLKDEYEVEEGK